MGRLGSGMRVSFSFQLRYRRSLYTCIDWRMMVVVGGKCPTPCKKGGRIVRAGEMSGRICAGGNALHFRQHRTPNIGRPRLTFLKLDLMMKRPRRVPYSRTHKYE